MTPRAAVDEGRLSIGVAERPAVGEIRAQRYRRTVPGSVWSMVFRGNEMKFIIRDVKARLRL